jgi:hypothetical protein
MMKNNYSWINKLGIWEAQELFGAVQKRMCDLQHKLRSAVPDKIYRKFRHMSTSDLVWNGGMTFYSRKGIGRDLPSEKANKFCQKEILFFAPLAEAWKKFGVVLDEVRYDTLCTSGAIAIHFSLKKPAAISDKEKRASFRRVLDELDKRGR